MSLRKIIPMDTITSERIVKHLKPLFSVNPRIQLKRFRGRPVIITEKRVILPGDIIKIPGNPKLPKGRLKKV